MTTPAPDPATIAESISRRILGQDEAIREMAVALSKQLAGLRVGNILMIGSSGTGKTTLMRAVESYLASDPVLTARSAVIRIHANVLGEEAERGRPGEAVLGRLLERAREQLGPSAPVDMLLRRATSGLVFVDEVDKIRSQVGGQPNVAGIRAQEALLTLIENEAVPLALPAWAGGGSRTVDSSDLLFVCAGAFEGLYDSVFNRVTIGKDRGALQPVTVVEGGKVMEKLVFSLRDWLRNEDLFDYGMSPQFLFESRGIHLAISPAAVRRVATEAGLQPRLGARALKEVFRRVIRDYEFEPAKFVNGGALLIDLPEVEAVLGKG